jgi:hypothetical protein
MTDSSFYSSRYRTKHHQITKSNTSHEPSDRFARETVFMSILSIDVSNPCFPLPSDSCAAVPAVMICANN